jgi:succinate-acetate transporter protein
MGREYITCRRVDTFGNAIPLGSFCYAIAFIIYGFYRCKIYRVNDTFLWSIILLFGGIGQCTAGFLEYCRGRSFPSALYLTFGFYCLSHYAWYTIPSWFVINYNNTLLYNYSENSICAFYSAWVVIAFGLCLASARTNVLYILQCLTAFVFFLLRAIGEGMGSLGCKRNAAGILQAISGFFSLLICISQILNNETFYRGVFPTCPLSQYNDIDDYGMGYPPMVAPPTVPVAVPPA